MRRPLHRLVGCRQQDGAVVRSPSPSRCLNGSSRCPLGGRPSAERSPPVGPLVEPHVQLGLALTCAGGSRCDCGTRSPRRACGRRRRCRPIVGGPIPVRSCRAGRPFLEAPRRRSVPRRRSWRARRETGRDDRAAPGLRHRNRAPAEPCAAQVREHEAAKRGGALASPANWPSAFGACPALPRRSYPQIGHWPASSLRLRVCAPQPQGYPRQGRIAARRPSKPKDTRTRRPVLPGWCLVHEGMSPPLVLPAHRITRVAFRRRGLVRSPRPRLPLERGHAAKRRAARLVPAVLRAPSSPPTARSAADRLTTAASGRVGHGDDVPPGTSSRHGGLPVRPMGCLQFPRPASAARLRTTTHFVFGHRGRTGRCGGEGVAR